MFYATQEDFIRAPNNDTRDYIETLRNFLIPKYEIIAQEGGEGFQRFVLLEKGVDDFLTTLDVEQSIILSGIHVISTGIITNEVYEFHRAVSLEYLAELTLEEFSRHLVSSQSGMWGVHADLGRSNLKEYVLQETGLKSIDELKEADKMLFEQIDFLLRYCGSKEGDSKLSQVEYEAAIESIIHFQSFTREVSWFRWTGEEDQLTLNVLKNIGKVYSYGLIVNWLLIQKIAKEQKSKGRI